MEDSEILARLAHEREMRVKLEAEVGDMRKTQVVVGTVLFVVGVAAGAVSPKLLGALVGAL